MIAPAKLNLCLYLGPRRPDGLHEICSLFAPISLADRLSVSDAAGATDEVLCPGIPSPDLTARALDALRAAGWGHPPLRVEVEKRIPVAAGLGGGSADAAAILRLADGDPPADEVRRIAAQLGADVPSQLDPRFALVGGAGESSTPLPEPPSWAVVLLPDPSGLSSAEVYAEADRLGLPRGVDELAELRGAILAATADGASPLAYPSLLVNDLAPAAISLRPSIAAALDALAEAGAERATVTGSGPTAFGLFAQRATADAAATSLEAGGREAIVAEALAAGAGAGA